MKAYIYQAALLCEDCGSSVRRNHLDTKVECRHEDLRQNCEDSDCTPQGPYPDGGGESDCPQHCDHCGVFLENPLTEDGEAYVKKFNPSIHYGTLPDAWREHYAYLFVHPEWLPEYLQRRSGTDIDK